MNASMPGRSTGAAAISATVPELAASATSRDRAAWPGKGFRRYLAAGDALFLIVMGCFGLAADLASYTAGVGPFGATFLDTPQVIGVVEAHGLALLIGVLAWLRFRPAPDRLLHWELAAAHLLLGGANIAFFDVFRQVGAEQGGVAVTFVHFILAALQAASAIGNAPD